MPKIFYPLFICLWFSACKSSSTSDLLKVRPAKERYYYPVNQEQYFNKQLPFIRMRTMVDSMYANDKNKNFWSTYFYYASQELVAYMKEQNIIALQYADSAIAWIEQYGMQASMPKDYGQMLLQRGRNYLALGNIPLAYEWHYKASEFIERYQDACGRAGYIHSLAGVLYTQGSYALAKEKYKEELVAARLCSADQYYMHYGREQELLDNIGLCYLQLKNIDSAAIYFEEALATVEKYKYLACDSTACLARYATNKGVILGNYAKVYIVKNELAKAEELYKQSILLNTGDGYERADAQLCMFQVSKVMINLGKIGEAKKMLDQLKKSLDSLPNVYALRGWNEMMSLYYAKQLDPKNELLYYKRYVSLKDSLEQNTKALKQNSLLGQLEDKKKEVQLNALQIRNNQQTNILAWVLIGLLGLLVITAIIYWFYRQTKKNNELLIALNNTIQEQNIRNEETLILLQKSNIEKDRILKVVAHDLRNPISGLAALLQTLIEGDLDEERRMKMMEVAKNTSALSMHLIDDLLKADNNSTFISTRFSINSLVEESIQVVENKAKEKEQQIKFIPKGVFDLHANKDKIQRVLLNLLSNAIKFSFQGSTIIVDLYKKDNTVLITVIDEGIGIDPSRVESIFYGNTDTRVKGTNSEDSFGFGLPICKAIIEEHGGRVWVESTLHKGSSFFIAIPLS